MEFIKLVLGGIADYLPGPSWVWYYCYMAVAFVLFVVLPIAKIQRSRE